VASARLILVSDTHLSAEAPEGAANWAAVVDHVAAEQPDLVVHIGDLTLAGSDKGADLEFGRAALDRLGAPWRAVPGNHDIGDNPWPGAPQHYLVDAMRHQRWLDVLGADRFSLELAGWSVVAINAQLFGSGLPAEAEQWEWIERAISPADSRPVLLITHKPMAAPPEELAAAPAHRFLPADARAELAARFGDRQVVVVSGHVHQHRVLHIDGHDHVWVPTTWAVIPEEVQPTFGTKRCGVLSLTLHEAGEFATAIVEPTGLAQQMLGVDLPNPYAH
jgi:3',5'-cyclic AMP phosphodiesterase CpdA